MMWPELIPLWVTKYPHLITDKRTLAPTSKLRRLLQLMDSAVECFARMSSVSLHLVEFECPPKVHYIITLWLFIKWYIVTLCGCTQNILYDGFIFKIFQYSALFTDYNCKSILSDLLVRKKPSHTSSRWVVPESLCILPFQSIMLQHID